MTSGRPTRYKPEYCDLIDVYLKENQDERRTVTKYETNKSTGFEEKLLVKLPTIGGYLLLLNQYIKDNLEEGEEYKPIWESTIYDWKKQHPIFSESLGKIVKEQEKRLLNMGLSGEYNSTIAKLILSSNHGYAEKTESTQKHIVPSEETKERVTNLLRQYVNTKRDSKDSGEGDTRG